MNKKNATWLLVSTLIIGGLVYFGPHHGIRSKLQRGYSMSKALVSGVRIPHGSSGPTVLNEPARAMPVSFPIAKFEDSKSSPRHSIQITIKNSEKASDMMVVRQPSNTLDSMGFKSSSR